MAERQHFIDPLRVRALLGGTHVVGRRSKETEKIKGFNPREISVCAPCKFVKQGLIIAATQVRSHGTYKWFDIPESACIEM